MGILVLISRAHADTAFRLAEEMYLDGEDVYMVFTGRGTHHCDKEEVVESLVWANLYTFETEFNSTCEAIDAIGYDFFVDLLENCDTTFSWI